MPRYRKITPVNIAERDRVIKEKSQPIPTPPPAPQPRKSMPLLPIRRPVRSPAETRSFGELFTSTCSNLKGVCNSMRSFADDMDNLISSVESITPVLTTVVTSYAQSAKNKDKALKETSQQKDFQQKTDINKPTNPTPNEPNEEFIQEDISDDAPSADLDYNDNYQPQMTRSKATNSAPASASPNNTQPRENQAPPRLPSKEEFEQFMSNPLVKSLLQTVLQSKNK